MFPGDILEEVMRFKYLVNLIAGNNNISEEVKTSIVHCRQCVVIFPKSSSRSRIYSALDSNPHLIF
jgi:hypothetical protein